MVLRVVAVDDEPLARERVSTLVRETHGLELVGEGSNGLEALDLIASLRPDLVFIDVEMPELSGLGVVAALEGDAVPAIVFVTAYDHYAIRAFEVGAVDYLQKPVTPKRFAATIARVTERWTHRSAAVAREVVAGAAAAERTRGHRGRFVLKRGDAHYFLAADQVEWIDVADNYLQLHVGGRVHLWRGTITQVVDELDPDRFVRIHRSTIVAVSRIKSVRASSPGVYDVELHGGVRLRSSRTYATAVRALVRS